jgi:hypothetical protein
MPAPAHVQAATIEKFISGWKKWTFEDWTATWSPDCVQKMLPTTLGIPPKSFDEVRAFLPKLMGVLSNYEVSTWTQISLHAVWTCELNSFLLIML